MSNIKCSNCGKEIESSKMFLHERFCSLNVRKCSICEEPIQIDEYNEHKILSHPDKKCEFCGFIFANKEYDAHYKTCSKKLFDCQYCGLYMNKSELKDHEYQCGGKSITCEYCKMNVTKMEYDLHLQYTCEKKIKLDKKTNNNINNENKTNNYINKKTYDDNDLKKSQKKDDDIINSILSKNNHKDTIKVGVKKRKRSSNEDEKLDKNKQTNKSSYKKKKK